MVLAAAAVALLAGWSGSLAYARLAEAEGLRRGAEAQRAARSAEHAAFTEALAAMRPMTIAARPDQSLSSLLEAAAVRREDIARVMAAVRPVFAATRLSPGQPVELVTAAAEGGARLTGLAFHSEPGWAVTVARTYDGRFQAFETATPLQSEVAHVAGAIEGSLYASALARGATDREVADMAEVFGYDVDFQRDIRAGDVFEMVFDREHDELGRTVRTGELMFVALVTRGGPKAFYRFQAPGDAKPEWYDAEGKTARKFLMRTPINGARLSSGFGMRRHPILGYSKLHRGTDFAAPTGTPIFAAGDGVIVQAGTNGGYGRYIRIKHDSAYQTAYAHMSRFAKGMRAGVRVAQGQVIGYVGSTGRSTGPHLHYEVHLRGQQINPMSLRVPTGRRLEGSALAAFQGERARIDALRAAGRAFAASDTAAPSVAFAMAEPRAGR